MTEDGYLAALFAAGALSVADGAITEKEAEALVSRACDLAPSIKAAAYDDDDEDSTWWSRNRHWALPTALTSLAFLLGAGAERAGRPDRSYLSNAGSFLWNKIKALTGEDNPLYKATVKRWAWGKPKPAAGKDPAFGPLIRFDPEEMFDPSNAEHVKHVLEQGLEEPQNLKRYGEVNG